MSNDNEQDPQMLEVRIESQDATLIAEIESALAGVNVKRWEKTRELLTVLTIASSAVGLVNALLDLRKKLLAMKQKTEKPAAAQVFVLNADRDQLAVAEVTAAKLKELIDSAKS
jgi:hypothetical protein